MHEDWRTERDRALLALEAAKRPSERAHAAELLVHLGLEEPSRRPELAALIPRLVDDPQDRVRRRGVALGALVLPPEEAETFLSRWLKDDATEVRVEAVGQLADLARPSSRGMFAAALEDPAFTVRFEAARGMAALQHPAGLDVLLQGLDKVHLRFKALGALAELGDARAVPPIRKVHARWLISGFERTQAAGALARLGDAAGAAWLVERAKKRRGADRALAVELLGEVKAPGALELLTSFCADPKDGCRGPAARGLGRLGDPRGVAPLKALLETEAAHPEDRLDAAEGLLLLGVAEGRAEVEAFAPRAPPPLQPELRTMLEEYR